MDDSRNSAVWQQRASLVKKAIHDHFYIASKGFFSDCLHTDQPGSVENAVADDALRPNQLFLITLGVVTDPGMSLACVESCLELLVPGAIRSLSNRRVQHPLPVELDGTLLNDPFNPYQGVYEGDEDRCRKKAYHNGTAWTWPFPVFCEAWGRVFGPKSHTTARAWLSTAVLHLHQGTAGFMPEVMDGDIPHQPRGCDAQAWGNSEFARVLKRLAPHDAPAGVH